MLVISTVSTKADEYDINKEKIIVHAVNSAAGIKVSWTEDKYADGYYVYKKEANGSYKKIAKVKKGVFSYEDKTNLWNGKTYYYAVKGYRGTYRSSFVAGICKYTGSNVVNINAAFKKITNTKYGTLLTWDPVKGASEYWIYRKNKGDTSYKKIAVIKNATSHTDERYMPDGNIYTYAIKAINGKYQSKYTPKDHICLKVNTIKNYTLNSSTKMTIKWNVNPNVDGYQIRIKTGSDIYKTYTYSGNTRTSAGISGLKKGTTYSVYLRTYKILNNVKYYSAWSYEKTIKLVNPALYSKKYIVTCDGRQFSGKSVLGTYSTYNQALNAINSTPYKNEWFIYEVTDHKSLVYPDLSTPAKQINNAINWAKAIAADNTHGYSCYGELTETGLDSKWDRWGKYGEYSCSSLVASALENSGFVNLREVAKANNMKMSNGVIGLNSTNFWPLTLKSGKFRDITNEYKANGVKCLQPGDILGNSKHVMMYIGNNTIVEATMNELNIEYAKATPGDQTGKEIRVGRFYGKGSYGNWVYAVRPLK